MRLLFLPLVLMMLLGQTVQSLSIFEHLSAILRNDLRCDFVFINGTPKDTGQPWPNLVTSLQLESLAPFVTTHWLHTTCLVLVEDIASPQEYEQLLTMFQKLAVSKRVLVSRVPRNVSQYEDNLHLSFTAVVPKFESNVGEEAHLVFKPIQSLQGRKLKVLHTSPWPHLVLTEVNGSSVATGGTNILYTNAMSEKFGFTYSVTRLLWYKKVNNGVATGLFPSIQAREGDLGLGEPIITHERFTEADFSTYTYLWDLGIKTLKPKEKDPATTLLLVFDVYTWSALAVLTTTISLFLIAADYISQSRHEVDIFHSLSLALVSPLQESLPNRLFHFTEFQARYVTLFFWLILGNVISMAYRSNLLAALATKEYDKPLQNAEEVLDSGMRVYALAGALLSQGIRDSSRPVFQAIYRDLVVGKGGLYDSGVDRTQMNLEVERGESLMVGSRAGTERDYKFVFIDDSFIKGFTGMIAPKGSQVLQMVDPVIQRLQAAGIISKWESSFFFEDYLVSAWAGDVEFKETTKEKPLDFIIFRLTFTLFAIGMCLSGLAFIGEITNADRLQKRVLNVM